MSQVEVVSLILKGFRTDNIPKNSEKGAKRPQPHRHTAACFLLARSSARAGAQARANPPPVRFRGHATP